MKWQHLSLFLITLATNLAAVPLERETAQLAEKLSAQYRKDQDSNIRRNLAVQPLRHLNLPDPIVINLGGFTWSPALTVYF